MLVVQYPHTITATIVTESHQDNNGNWVPGGSTNRVITGRAEPNGSGRMVQLADGSQIVYNWVIYMPKGTTPLPDGAEIVVTWNTQAVGRGKVLRFSQGQLNSRLWL